MKWILYISLCCIVSQYALAQTPKVDSLRRIILSSPNDSVRLKSILLLCEQISSIPPDTLYQYASRAKTLAQKSDNKQDNLWSEYYIASALSLKGNRDTAMQILNANYNAAQNLINNPKIGNYYSFLKGKFLMKDGKRIEAMQLFYKVLGKSESNKDTFTTIVAQTSIGWVYMELDQNREALNWFFKAIKQGSPHWFTKYSIVFSNIAATYNSIHKNDSAEIFINKALYYLSQTPNLVGRANALAIQSGIFSETGRIPLAEKSMNEALTIRRQIGDPFYIVSDIAELGNFYALHGPYQKGINLCKEGIEMATHFNIQSKLPILYNALANNYKASGDYLQYGKTIQRLLEIKDSTFTQKTSEALATLQAKYDVQKNENTILQQGFQLNQSRYRLFASLIFSIVIIASGFFLFRSYRRRQALKMELLQKEEKRIAENEVLLAREAERKRIAADLHDSLGAYASSIAVNVKQLEAQTVSIANRPIIEELKNNSQEVVSQLRNTIWALKKDALPLTAVSDRIKSFIQHLQKSYSTTSINVIENIEVDFILSPSHAYHLFRIAQEAINNALKHSAATEIIIIIKSMANLWEITISDDGAGIGESSVSGNGMINMRERSNEVECTIQWIQLNPSGTCVVISKANPELSLHL
ncbi:MAG: sensor histidine kinase [Bacteroidetes bacterium]|nr:sensor histidine kinase [Bacteroidota bacterium]